MGKPRRYVVGKAIVKATDEEIEAYCRKVLRWSSAKDFGSLLHRFNCAPENEYKKVLKAMKADGY